MVYQFGDCVVDSRRHTLDRCGERIEIEPKQFQVLLYLLQHHNELISRQALLENCWPRVYISDGTLTSCLGRVRQAIGHSAEQKLIETVHRKGYRFVGVVTEHAGELPNAPPTNDVNLPVSLVTESPSPSLPLSPLRRSRRPATPTMLPVTAERRQLTVLSGRWVEDSDDEDIEVEASYQRELEVRQRCLAAVTPLGGHLVQTIPGEVLVYFGYPRAVEDSARRAVLAGLRLIEQMVPTPLRVGIHTGPVVIEAAMSTGEPPAPAAGPTQTRAVRLGHHASPQRVLISETTARLVAAEFDWQPLTPRDAQHLGQTCYQINGERQSDTPPARLSVTPFVGRELELALLGERWAQVQEGQGQVVLLSGEPGIGKSRLVQQLSDQVIDRSYPRLACYSSPYHRHTAFFPLLGLLRQVLHERAAGDGDELAALEALESLVEHFGLTPAEEAVPLLAGLLSIAVPPARYPPLALDGQQQRRQHLQLMVQLVLAQTQRQSLLLTIEDLHWADPSTLAFIEQLIPQTPATALLLVLTCRPAFAPPWDLQVPVTPLRLDRLSRQHSQVLLSRLTDGKALPDGVRAQITAKTDGVPLFIEEITRALLDSGQLQNTERGELRAVREKLSIPMTLQESLMARLDQLPTGKLVAQWGAVLGREFEHAVLTAISPLDEAKLREGLSQLQAAGLLFQRGVTTQTQYLFKHALVRDVAYQSLLKRQRQHIHGEVARALEASFPAIVSGHPELLAQHYTQAQRIPEALPHWTQAGRQAAKRWAHQEAVEHLTTALSLLQGLSDADQRASQELEIQILLGPELIALRGPATQEAIRCFERARTLCQCLGDTEHLFPILANLWRITNGRGDYRVGQRLGEELLAEAQRQNQLQLVQSAHQMLGASLSYQGKLLDGCDQLQRSLLLAEQLDNVEFDARYSLDPRMLCLAFLIRPLLFRGYADQALQKSWELETFVEQLRHPHSVAMALHYLAIFHLNLHDLQAVSRFNNALIALADEQQLPHFSMLGSIKQGWLLTTQGQLTEGLAQMRQVIAEARAADSGLRYVGPLLQLAEGCCVAGCADQGLQAITEGFALLEVTEERMLESALHRVRGVLLLQKNAPDPVQAEASFRQALDVACQQQARWWELRAAANLAKLWHDQGKTAQAYRLLAPVYGWFTEGFDTVHLTQAKALLVQLQAQG